jgi:hypothetical protein
MEHYLRTGDWIGIFSGANEEHKVVPTCVAMAYYPDGTPKRSAGVFYPDINMVWKQDMIEVDYVPVDPTIAITDKQFTANL